MSTPPPLLAKRALEDDAGGGVKLELALKRQCMGEKEFRVSFMATPGVRAIKCVFARGDDDLLIATKTGLYSKAYGRVTLIAGHCFETGFKDGERTEARFHEITGLALTLDGDVLVVDKENHSVRLVSAGGKVTTVAGTGNAGFKDGMSFNSQFNSPHGIVVNSKGYAFVTDTCNKRIRRMNPNCFKTNWRSQVQTMFVNGSAGDTGFKHPMGLALDMEENLIVADHGDKSVYRVGMPDCRVTRVAVGIDSSVPFVDTEENLLVVVDGSNNIFVADTEESVIFQIPQRDGTVFKVLGADKATCCAESMTIDKKGRLILVGGPEHDEYELSIVHVHLVPPLLRANMNDTLRSLQGDYAILLEDDSLMDCTVSVHGGGSPRVFRAHRMILSARSLCLKKLFEANEAYNAEISLKDISGPTFKIVLHYLYTGQRPRTTMSAEDASVCSIAHAAKLLELEALYQDCLNEFKEMLDVAYVIDDLIEAHEKELFDFKSAGLLFVEENAGCILMSDMDCLDVFKERQDLIELLLDVTRALGSGAYVRRH